MAEKPLTPKQAAFVREYLVDLNATQAAIRAGYSEATARQQAARLLSKANVAQAVRGAQDRRAKKVEVTQLWVLERLVENHARAMQAEPVRDRKGRETGEYVYAGNVANKALELLGKHLGMFVDNVNLRTPEPLEIAITRKVVPTTNRVKALVNGANGSNGTNGHR